MTRQKWQELSDAVMQYIREKHEKEIDGAYEFFWEEEDPSEFLGGTALTMGFHNFEDWLVNDYIPEDKAQKPYIDKFIEATSPSDEDKAALEVMKNSHISLYEVKSAGDKSILLDMATGKDVEVTDERLKSLAAGNIFGARLLDVGEGNIMTQAIYPFGTERFKEQIMEHLDAMYGRHAKHCEGDTCMEDFLRKETYTINTVWVTCLFRVK